MGNCPPVAAGDVMSLVVEVPGTLVPPRVVAVDGNNSDLPVHCSVMCHVMM